MDGIRFDHWTRTLSRRKGMTGAGTTGVAALSMRDTFPNGNSLVLSGVDESDIETCAGALSGVFGGPNLGVTGSRPVDPARSELISPDNGGNGGSTLSLR